MVTKKIFFSSIVGLILSIHLFGAAIPKRPEPQRLLNDAVGLFENAQANALEQKLIAIDDSTSVQIAVVVLPELYGYDANALAYEIGQQWGVGQKGKNNGVVILIKPKIGNERGYVSIQVGYGLESVVTDALAKRIIENELIPSFRENNFFNGTNKAIDAIVLASKGMYKADAKPKKSKSSGAGIAIIITIIILIVLATSNKNNKKNHKTIGRSEVPLWMLMGMGMSGRSSGSGWGNFSSGSGSFGGFGGGSFGGGGASGSW